MIYTLYYTHSVRRDKPGRTILQLAAVIAHYNYTLRFRSCGLSREAKDSALRTRKDAALDYRRALAALGKENKFFLLSLAQTLTRQGLSALCNPSKESLPLCKLRLGLRPKYPTSSYNSDKSVYLSQSADINHNQ